MTPTPANWTTAPPWSNWFAWDQWGTAWYYATRPELLTFDAVDWITGEPSIWQCWRPVDAAPMYPAAVLPLVDGRPVEVDGWQDTLEARP